MSRIGKLPIKLPEGVDISMEGDYLSVKGPKGELKKKIPEGILVEEKEGSVLVSVKKENKALSSIHGTTRAIIANMIHGVIDGWSKVLELVGTGYRAEVSNGSLILTVGYSHPVEIKAPEGISFKVEKTDVTVDGSDKELVGQVAANIRAVRPPEPYKGKGIKYKDEVVRRKPGKTAKAQGVAA
jgi:large subunit ribosomal protein L6